MVEKGNIILYNPMWERAAILLHVLSGVLVTLTTPCACLCACLRTYPDACDGVDILCHEQHSTDVSFTWQLQDSSDVSESAEALIRTRVNHCSGNPEEIEAACGEVSKASGQLLHRRPAALRWKNAGERTLIRVCLSPCSTISWS